MRTVRRTILGQFVQTGACPRCRGHGPGDRVALRGMPGGRPGLHGAQGHACRSPPASTPASASGCRGAGERASAARGPATSTCGCRWLAHELFERRDDDILYGVDLTMVQAALGTTLTIPTLDGDEEVTFAPGTQPGDVKVLRGKGVQHLNGHGRGDQEIHVRVLIPRDLDEQQRRLLQEFDEACGAEHYGDREEGVLQKLRNWFSG